MALPGLGGGKGDEEALKPFDPRASKAVPARVPDSDADADAPIEEPERYSMGDSHFFDCLRLDQAGRGGDELPPALTPTIGLKFPLFDARIEAKYGVRNYVRLISQYFSEIDAGFGKILPKMTRGHVPLQAAISIVEMYRDAHIYDLRVRQIKNARKNEFYIRSLEPRSGHTKVARFTSDDVSLVPGYQEDVVMLVQREVLIGGKNDEIMWSLQPVAFTYHAMLRLWERGACNGQNFHLIMAEAFKRLRGVSALVELSCLLTEGKLPHYIAVPMLDGFMVVSRRDTVARSEEARWGGRRNGRGGQELRSQEEDYFVGEAYLQANGDYFTEYDCWFAATYMGANDLGGWQRSLAAEKFNELLVDVDLDHVARVRERIMRSSSKSQDMNIRIELPHLHKVMELQREMLPRPDAPDDRIHFIDF